MKARDWFVYIFTAISFAVCVSGIVVLGILILIDY